MVLGDALVRGFGLDKSQRMQSFFRILSRKLHLDRGNGFCPLMGQKEKGH